MTPTPTRRKKTLIFHIGDHKTGSTSIQLAFAKRRVSLKDHSLFYPAKLASNMLGDQFKAYYKADTPEAREDASILMRNLARKIRKSNADFVLVSAEAFEGVPAAIFKDVFDTFFADTADEIRFFCYVRPHSARITSTFAERTKIGGPRVMASSLESYATHLKGTREFFYLKRFEAWHAAFGDRFHLRPMIRDQLYRKSVVDDFIHHAFGGIDFEISGTDAANESLCLDDLMRLKVLQTMYQGPRKMRLRLGWEMARIVGTLPPPKTTSKLRLHRSLAEDIRDTYMDDARAMDEMFFGGTPMLENELYTAVEKAQDQPQSTDPADYFPESELRSLELLSTLIISMLEHDQVNWPEFLHSKRLDDVRKALKETA